MTVKTVEFYSPVSDNVLNFQIVRCSTTCRLKSILPQSTTATATATATMSLPKKIKDLIVPLNLIPHPEGGFFVETHRSGSVPMASKVREHVRYLDSMFVNDI